MSRPTLALLWRGLLEQERSLSTLGWRLAVLTVLYFAVFIVWESSAWRSAPGHQLLNTLGALNAVLITLIGIASFGSSIAEEKQDGTLGLLRMTRLGPLAILLGKSMASVVGLLQLLAVQLPVAILALPLGGATLAQVLHLALALVAHLVLMAGVGVLASVLCRTPRWAGALVIVLLVGLWWVPHLVLILCSLATVPPAWLVTAAGHVAGWSVWMRLSAITEMGYDRGWIDAHWIASLALGGLAFLAAWAVFERMPADAERPVVAGGRARGWFRRGRRFSGAVVPLRPYGRFPYLLKDFRHVAGGWRWCALRFGIYTGIVGLLLLPHLAAPGGYWNSPEAIGVRLLAVSFYGFVIETSLLLSRVLRVEVRDQTLTALGVLPISLPAIAYQKVGGALLGLMPVVCVAGIGVWLVDSGEHGFFRNFFGQPVLLLAFVCHGVFYTHLVVMFSVLLRRGGLIAAIAVFALVITVEMLFIGGGGSTGSTPENFIAMFSLGLLVPTAILHGITLERLRVLAAQ